MTREQAGEARATTRPTRAVLLSTRRRKRSRSDAPGADLRGARRRRLVGFAGVVRHGHHRFGVWVVGVRASCALSFGVAVGSSRPSASSLRPISSSRGGRFGQVRRRASCWIVSGWRSRWRSAAACRRSGRLRCCHSACSTAMASRSRWTLRLQLRDLLGLVERLVLDRVGVARRARSAPRWRRNGGTLIIAGLPASPRCAAARPASSARSSGSCAGASVRSPARSFAERARGLRAHLGLAGHDRAASSTGAKVGGARLRLGHVTRAAGGRARCARRRTA